MGLEGWRIRSRRNLEGAGGAGGTVGVGEAEASTASGVIRTTAGGVKGSGGVTGASQEGGKDGGSRVRGEGSTGGIRGAGGAGRRSMMEGTETEPLLGPAPASRRTRTSQVPLLDTN